MPSLDTSQDAASFGGVVGFSPGAVALSIAPVYLGLYGVRRKRMNRYTRDA